MTLSDELFKRIAGYEEKAKEYKDLAAAARLLLAQERASGVPGPPAMASREEPESVIQAVAILLARGPARYSDLPKMIRAEFPAVAAKVKGLPKAVGAALFYGKKKGKYRAIERGLWTVVAKEES